MFKYIMTFLAGLGVGVAANKAMKAKEEGSKEEFNTFNTKEGISEAYAKAREGFTVDKWLDTTTEEESKQAKKTTNKKPAEPTEEEK